MPFGFAQTLPHLIDLPAKQHSESARLLIEETISDVILFIYLFIYLLIKAKGHKGHYEVCLAMSCK